MEGKLSSWALWEDRNRTQRAKMDEEMVGATVRDLSNVNEQAVSRLGVQGSQIVGIMQQQ